MVQIHANQKVFISFAFTGQNKRLTQKRLKNLCTVFKAHGVSSYCDLFDKRIAHLHRPAEFIIDAIRQLKNHDILLVIKDSPHRSEGMLIEMGAALACNVPVITLLHESAQGTTYTDDPLISANVIVWNTEEELIAAVEKLIV